MGNLEVRFTDEDKGGATLFFAPELAATGTLGHVRGAAIPATVPRLFRHAFVAYRWATRAVDCITVYTSIGALIRIIGSDPSQYADKDVRPLGSSSGLPLRASFGLWRFTVFGFNDTRMKEHATVGLPARVPGATHAEN